MRHVVVKLQKKDKTGWIFKCVCGFIAEMTAAGNYSVTAWGDRDIDHQALMYNQSKKGAIPSLPRWQ